MTKPQPIGFERACKTARTVGNMSLLVMGLLFVHAFWSGAPVWYFAVVALVYGLPGVLYRIFAEFVEDHSRGAVIAEIVTAGIQALAMAWLILGVLLTGIILLIAFPAIMIVLLVLLIAHSASALRRRAAHRGFEPVINRSTRASSGVE